MEKKKRDKKVASANGQEPHSNDFLSKEEENGIKSNALHSNASTPDHHYPQALQGQYTSQCSAEQPALIPRSHEPSISTRSIFSSQWQQAPTLQQNAINQHLHFAQSNPPFWMPQRPGYQLAGVNIPGNFQPLSPVAPVDACCQASAMLGGNSSRSQLPVPNPCYHVNHPYSGFPGPWDHTPWWAHSQPPQPSCTYNFPVAYGHVSSQPPLVATFGESFSRGTIRPKAKLSQKHQQLWEAQSAENVQLWSVIAQLQSEIADHKSRLTKIEAEISSIRPPGNEIASQVTTPTLASKRGRPKRTATSADVLASPNGSRPRVRGKKPAAASKPQIEATAEENGEKKINGDHVMETNGGSESTPAFQGQLHQICQFGTNSISEVKISDGKANDSKTSKIKGASIMEIANNDEIGWPASVYPEENGRNLCFYDNGRMTVTRGNEWHLVDDQEGASDGAAAKVGNEEEVEDGTSSGTEENIGRRKNVVDVCDVDDAAGIGSSSVPQYNNW